MAAVRSEPGAALLEQLANPVQRLEVVLQRRPPEQPHLRDVRRAKARQAALAFDRFDHRRLFAADVRPGAAAQEDLGKGRNRRVGLQRRDLRGEGLAAAVVLVAQVDVDAIDADRPGRDQHALEKAMRIGFEQNAILERSRLAFVDVDGHQPRRGLGADDAPLAPGREARAAEAAQARLLERRDHRLDVALAGEAGLQQRVAALAAVARVVDEGFAGVARRPGVDGGDDAFAAGARDRVLADDRRRRLLAAADAGRRDDANAGPEQLRQAGQQIAGSGDLARQAVADANGQRRRRGLAFLDDVEVVIEARDLVDLGLRQAHLLREGGEMRRREVAEAILDLVQVLDQEVALARLVAEQSPAPRASASGSTRRPLGAARLRCRVDASGAIGMTGRERFRAAPRHAPIGTSRRAPRPGSRSSTHRPECRARRGTAPLPRPRRRRPATPRSA